MSKLIAILFAGLVFASCSIIPTASVSDFPMPSEVTNPMQAWKWVSHNIHYVSDSSNLYHTQTPSETMAKRTGDCKSFSLLLCAMLDQFDCESWIVYGETDHGYHAVVYCSKLSIDGLIEPQTYGSHGWKRGFHETSRMSYQTYKMLVDGGWQSY